MVFADQATVRQQALDELFHPFASGIFDGKTTGPVGLQQPVAYNPALGTISGSAKLHGKRQGDYVDALGKSYSALMGLTPPGYQAPVNPFGNSDGGYNHGDLNPELISATQALRSFSPWGGLTDDIAAQYTAMPTAPNSADYDMQSLEGLSKYNLDKYNYDQSISAAQQRANLFNNYKTEYDKWTSTALTPKISQQFKEMGFDLTGAPGVTSAEQGQNMLNAQLTSMGIKDLRDVKVADNGTMYNIRTGQAINPYLWDFRGGNGDGSLDVFFNKNADGSVGIGTDFDKPKMQFGDYVGAAIPGFIMGMIAPYAVPALAGAMGGGTAATIGAGALYGAGSGALGATINGGDAGDAALLGAISGGVGGAFGNAPGQYNPGASITSSAVGQQIINRALSGGITGGLGAFATGADPRAAALSGALGGAASGASSTYLQGLLQNQFDFDPQTANMVGGTLGGIIGKGASAFVPVQGVQGTLPARRGGLEQAASQGSSTAQAAPDYSGLANLPQAAQDTIRRRLGIA